MRKLRSGGDAHGGADGVVGEAALVEPACHDPDQVLEVRLAVGAGEIMIGMVDRDLGLVGRAPRPAQPKPVFARGGGRRRGGGPRASNNRSVCSGGQASSAPAVSTMPGTVMRGPESTESNWASS